MSQVNTELTLASTTLISLGQASVRALAGVASGAISLDNLHGKSNTYSVSCLVVAGGGSGWVGYNGPGGGAGGYLSVNADLAPSTAYPITVGAGAPYSNDASYNGNNSSIGSLVIAYKGGGAHRSDGPMGSGGGVSQLGTAGQGHSGGTQTYYCCWTHTSGGGGGAGQAGQGSRGGNGLAWYDGVTRAGGGGGGVYPEYTSGNDGGSGGGGQGGQRDGRQPTSGAANTGSGGGGASHYGGSSGGGSGIVIIRYLGAQRGTGGTVTSSGGYTYHTFTSSGTYTA